MSDTTTKKGREQKDEQPVRPPIKNTIQSERLKALMAELDRPLEDEKWVKKPKAGEEKNALSLLSRLRTYREHRRNLKRARQAAARVYRVKPKVSARKRASLMMGVGAMSLGAFTGPPPQKPRPKPAAAVTKPIPPAKDVRMPAALMSSSDEFKQALIEEEGVRYTVYRDVAGYPTVGVGHLVLPQDNLRVGDRISDQQVLDFLDQDLKKAEEGVQQLVGDLPLYQHEFDALVDLVYNVGIGNVSGEKSPRLNAAIDAGDYEGIAAELDYTHAAGKVARGLEFRSERRAQIFMEAAYEDPREVRMSQS